MQELSCQLPAACVSYCPVDQHRYDAQNINLKETFHGHLYKLFLPNLMQSHTDHRWQTPDRHPAKRALLNNPFQDIQLASKTFLRYLKCRSTNSFCQQAVIIQMADTVNCKPLKCRSNTIIVLRRIRAQHLKPLLSYVNVHLLHLHLLSPKVFPRVEELLAAPEDNTSPHGNESGTSKDTNHLPPPKTLHYNFLATSNLHCNIYLSRCKC